jgi:hypothetical protein
VSPRPLTTRRRSIQDEGIEVKFARKTITIYPPSQPVIPTVSLPEELSMSRLQGYNGKTMRNNLFFIDDSLIVYSAGKFGVVYNLDIG